MRGPSITRRPWWNCEIAPASGGGVYVVWDGAGTVYLRSVGVALDLIFGTMFNEVGLGIALGAAFRLVFGFMIPIK